VQAPPTQTAIPGQEQPGSPQVHYRVNYRPSDTDPWQLYAQTRSLENANKIADDVRQSGYQAEVVDDATPVPQPYPDASDYSASDYYPISNYASTYNTYMLPGGGYNYGWYGGWYPGYRHHFYAGYWGNSGRYWHNGWWRGHGWNGGWNRGYGDGWNTSHRNWNYNHADRSSHLNHHERVNRNVHRMDNFHQLTTGHHAAGHYGAAWHAGHQVSGHHGGGHYANGRRTAGHQARAHFAGGHAGRGHARAAGGRGGGQRTSPGRNAGGQSARHNDP
jgi:hypothetical protein